MKLGVGTIGMLQSFGMRKRFGLIAEDEIARDLVTEINKEIGGDLIRKIAAVAQIRRCKNDRSY